MFDIAPSELLLVAVVALLVIGPKDLPLALRTAGRWLAKVRRMSGHFRAGVETMIREAELAEIEKEWQQRNARIMAEHPDAEALETALSADKGSHEMLPIVEAPQPNAESALGRAAIAIEDGADDEPAVPLRRPAKKRRA